MTKKIIIRDLLYGFLTWLIPFAISCLFFKPSGQLMVSQELFKSLMIVIGSFVSCYLLYRYFLLVNENYFNYGILVGVSWFLINILLDCLVLIPLMKITFAEYFKSIGLRYTVLLAIAPTMGLLLSRKETQM